MRTSRPCGPMAGREISRFPNKRRPHMPGSSTPPGRPCARADAHGRMAFRSLDTVGTRDKLAYGAQWLACALPCRRFVCGLTAPYARLGADADRYSFIVMDLHHLPLAGLPAHPKWSLEPVSKSGVGYAAGVTL